MPLNINVPNDTSMLFCGCYYHVLARPNSSLLIRDRKRIGGVVRDYLSWLYLVRSIPDTCPSQPPVLTFNAPAGPRALVTVTLDRPRPWAARGDRTRVVYK